MIPNYTHPWTGRLNHRNYLCANRDCKNYGKIVARESSSLCPLCREKAILEVIFKDQKKPFACGCILCWRRRFRKSKI